jgi:sodium transport system permease protein
MRLSNIKLIFFREVRDQLRDRRTMFTIVVLPILLYPLLGMSFLQVAQFMKRHPTTVQVIGAEDLPQAPPLLVPDEQTEALTFAESLCGTPEDAALLDVAVQPRSEFSAADDQAVAAAARAAIGSGECDAVLYFPVEFAERLRQAQLAANEPEPEGDKEAAGDESAEPAELPQPLVFFDAAQDKSRMAHDRVAAVLRAWRTEMVRDQLDPEQASNAKVEPFIVERQDVARDAQRRAAMWSRILPFIVLVWALTGAFYPAIDLCAGEKERGTLETLLSSPAMRGEIVWGKLLAIMLFSMATSLLNLASMGITGTLLIGQLQILDANAGGLHIGPPPLATMGWLLLGLVPISALFSALALAIAALARSTKEGQYYLLPLMLITMPLMILPMLPAAELDLGSSLIPVTGMLLLLRALMEGHFREALVFALPVLAVTFGCCLLSIRWAISQFKNESVLFRESERWSLQLWLKHLLRDREATPSVSMAVLCGVLLLVIRFFTQFLVPPPGSWAEFAVSTAVNLVAFIAAPALLMAVMLTLKPRKTLLLTVPSWSAIPAAIALAFVIHPVAMVLVQTVARIYPMSPDTLKAVMPLHEMINGAPLWSALLVIAAAPAICEELAFRGFILSGLRHMGHKWGAILLSAAFFGIAHGLLQQSLSAVALGLVLGFLATQSGSLYTCISFHFVYNSLSLLSCRVTPQVLDTYPLLRLLFQPAGDGCIYSTAAVAVGGVATIFLLLWFRQLPHRVSEEESLQQTLNRQKLQAGTS